MKRKPYQFCKICNLTFFFQHVLINTIISDVYSITNSNIENNSSNSIFCIPYFFSYEISNNLLSFSYSFIYFYTDTINTISYTEDVPSSKGTNFVFGVFIYKLMDFIINYSFTNIFVFRVI